MIENHINKLFLFTKVPSVNHYWKIAKGGHRYISPEGRAFKKMVEVQAKIKHFKVLEGDIEVVINWYKKGKMRGDLDNILKVILDSLKGLSYFDDSQVKSIHARMWEKTGKDAIEVIVSVIPPAERQELF